MENEFFLLITKNRKTMKTIKLYLSVCLLVMTTTTSAQFANSNAASSSTTNARSTDTNGWNRISVSYNPIKMIVDTKGDDDLSLTGFSLGYTKGFSIAKEFPLFMEVGINGLYASHTEDEDINIDGYEAELKTTLFSLNVPVNLVYRFSFPNSNISIIPYLGVNFKGNIIGKVKYNLTEELDEDYSEKDFWEEAEEYGYIHEANMFDKKEAGGKDSQWKRFQMGWQIGVGLTYNKLYVGVGYGKDFTELCKKVKVSTTSITLGYNF